MMFGMGYTPPSTATKSRHCPECNVCWPNAHTYNQCPRCEVSCEPNYEAPPEIAPDHGVRIIAYWTEWRARAADDLAGETGTDLLDPEALARADHATQITELEVSYALACRRDGTKATYA